MADEKTTRAAIDRVAQRIQKSQMQSNRAITFEKAREKAREIAIRHDRKNDRRG